MLGQRRHPFPAHYESSALRRVNGIDDGRDGSDDTDDMLLANSMRILTGIPPTDITLRDVSSSMDTIVAVDPEPDSESTTTPSSGAVSVASGNIHRTKMGRKQAAAAAKPAMAMYTAHSARVPSPPPSARDNDVVSDQVMSRGAFWCVFGLVIPSMQMILVSGPF